MDYNPVQFSSNCAVTMLKQESIPYMHQNLLLEGYSAYQSDEKRPLVILCHAWAGRDPYICEKAQEIGELGMVGFALDMYGKGVLGTSKEQNAALKKPFIQDRQLLQARILQGYETARKLPYVDPTRIAVLGFGFGGLCALDLARTGVPLKGTVSIYGHFDAPVDTAKKQIQGEILILHGFNDPVSPVQELLHFQQALEVARVPWQTHLFGNTFHAFANPKANDPIAGILYNPTAAQQAWDLAKAFLVRTLL